VKDFAALYARLDQTTKTNAKVEALTDYFASPTVPDTDKLWTVALFSGRRPRRTITATSLRDWAAERAGLPLWLFEESHGIVGDLSETISLILPPAARESNQPLAHWIARLRELSALPEPERRAASSTPGTPSPAPSASCSPSS
jgi:DNA ligase-1